MNAGASEIVLAFDRAGLAVHKTFREMLEEHPSHRTERRGCGYTQATRFLSTFINHPRGATDASDLGILTDWPKKQVEDLAHQAVATGWPHGWRRLHECPPELRSRLRPQPLVEALCALPATLMAIEQELRREENRVLMALIRALLVPSPIDAPALPAMPDKPEIGSCSQAEEFFLEIAHDRVRRGGRVNLFVADDGETPLLVEKMDLGESHSAMSVAPISICDVPLPPGSLFALRYPEDIEPLRAISCGNVLSYRDIREARFLRLTTFAVAPAIRSRAFSTQFENQIRCNMLSPANTTLDDLGRFALKRLSQR